uniref:RING finger protein 207 n=3 Tax=Meloidogyne incognita group TaxID=654580 RepID=A0A915MRV7_MELJA
MDVPSKAYNNPLNCLRCNSAMQDPVRLPCQHHFCRQCVNSSECTTCLRPFNLAELATDKVLNYIVESSREATETCANCDKISQPMYFCETCQQPLCAECREITHRAKIFLLHNIVQMEERGRIRNRPFCSAHNEPFILYCLESKSLMCIECFNSSSLERRGHFLNIDVAHKICCDKLEKSAVNLRAFQSELREQCDLRRRLVDELEKNFDFMAKEVTTKCDAIIFRVTQLKSFLLDKLDVEKTEKKDKIIDQLNNFEFLESPLAINLLSVSIFCSYASKIDLLHCYGDLSKLIQQFLSSNSQHLQKVKFDSNLNIDFAKEFNLSICQPLGFIQPPNTTENVLMSNKLIVGNSGKTAKNDSDSLMEQRFMDQFQYITVPLQKFTKEISFISTSLMDLHKDIVLRRCVVNGEELINRLACCENAWDQLEAHKKKVQMIIQQSLNQIWRRDIERVQRQQHLVKEKLEEMKHLQKLAQQALKISQHLKPFAVQMAGIISVIDVRRTTLTVLSPMEQICSEIGQIGMDSEIRVAAIDKEEKLRQQKIANSLANQALQNDAILALKNLKVVPSSSPKSTTKGVGSRQIVEVDRTRSDVSSKFCKNSLGTSSSPLTCKRRQQILSRAQRKSEGASSSDILLATESITKGYNLPEEIKQTTQLSPLKNEATTKMSADLDADVRKNMSAKLDEKMDCSPSIDSKEEETKPQLISFGKQIQKDKDPTVLLAREKLLESIKEKDPNQRDKYIEVRSELLKHSEGLLGALALPNYLDVEPEINQKFVLNKNFEKDLDEIVENVSGPYLVRPALVECCNICLNEVVLITDCVDPPLCLVGTNIPSFLSILVNGCLTTSNNWPLSLIASGPVYYKTTKNLAKFCQTEQISILTIGRDKEECVSRQVEIFTILENFLKKILKEGELEEFVKQPEDLQLWERSSLSICNKKDDVISQIASFSNIGDYISRRAHVVFDTGKNNKNLEIDKNPNYVQMAFATINLDNLIKCF